MSMTPALEIGIWNAWTLIVAFYLAMFIPNIVLGREAMKRTKRMNSFPPLSKFEKILALMTHVVLMPFVLIYAVFLPLKTGTAWLFAGLLIYAVSTVISVATLFNVAATPVDKPVTRGAYWFSRNPMYLSGFLLFVGVGLASVSWIVMLCGALWAILWQIVIPAEERFLLEKYGDSYRKYMSRTPRWIGIPGTVFRI
jgi:protein-S-isoprenylcysteine O-methyltransferase Ste14